MGRVIYLRLAGKDVHLPRLIGSFVVLFALLMFLKAGASMFESWDAVKSYPECVESANNEISDLVAGDTHVLQKQLAHMKLSECKQSFYAATGSRIVGEKAILSGRQVWNALLLPIGGVFLWAAVFVLGLLVYRGGEIVIPLEQSIRPYEGRERARKKN